MMTEDQFLSWGNLLFWHIQMFNYEIQVKLEWVHTYTMVVAGVSVPHLQRSSSGEERCGVGHKWVLYVYTYAWPNRPSATRGKITCFSSTFEELWCPSVFLYSKSITWKFWLLPKVYLFFSAQELQLLLQYALCLIDEMEKGVSEWYLNLKHCYHHVRDAAFISISGFWLDHMMKYYLVLR